MRTATTKEYPASSSVAGSRWPITCDTAMPESIDVPNRPANRFAQVVQVLQPQRVVQAELRAPGVDQFLRRVQAERCPDRVAGDEVDDQEAGRDQHHGRDEELPQATGREPQPRVVTEDAGANRRASHRAGRARRQARGRRLGSLRH